MTYGFVPNPSNQWRENSIDSRIKKEYKPYFINIHSHNLKNKNSLKQFALENLSNPIKLSVSPLSSPVTRVAGRSPWKLEELEETKLFKS